MSKKLNRAITDELWRRGELSFKLHKGQKDLYDLYHTSKIKKQVWLMARRFGKSHSLVVLALEQCLKHPNSIVKIASPTKDQVEKNLRPLFRDILDDCPEELKPEWHKADGIYFFKNGSEIQLAGTDKGHGEKLRGGNSHIAMVDEAGSCTDLKTLINDILMPTTLKTGGKIILASTPPSEMDHEFLEFIEEADAKGTLIRKTIRDNPLLSEQTIQEAIEEVGGMDSPSCRREYFCEIVKDSNRTVLPEVTKDLLSKIVKEWPRPVHYHSYEAMDIGFNDLTAILFAYFDFKNDKVIIEDEIVVGGEKLHLSKLADQIWETEAKHWTIPSTGEVNRPYLRVSDTNLVAINEIRQASQNRINFMSTDKDDKNTAINNLRMMLAAGKIIIHPRCKTLIKHIENVKWASNKKDFARSPDNGHYDAVDALIYLIRSINYRKNPYPHSYGIEYKDLFINNKPRLPENQNSSVFKQIFGRRK